MLNVLFSFLFIVKGYLRLVWTSLKKKEFTFFGQKLKVMAQMGECNTGCVFALSAGQLSPQLLNPPLPSITHSGCHAPRARVESIWCEHSTFGTPPIGCLLPRLSSPGPSPSQWTVSLVCSRFHLLANVSSTSVHRLFSSLSPPLSSLSLCN